MGSRTDMKAFTLQVLTGRWLMLFASFLMMASAGASYMFGLYSNDIKSSLGYSQTTLNLISFFKDLGANIGIFSGLINEVTPPWVVLSIGAAFNFFGYFMIWLAVTKKIAKPQVWHMCTYIAMGANSHTFINTGALVTCVKNFPRSRGLLLGLLNGYIGLSAAVIAQLYHALYGDDTKSFTLFVAWLPSTLSLIFLRTIRIMTVIPNKNDRNVLHKFFFISLGLAMFLLVIIIVEQQVNFTQSEYSGSAAVVIFLLFLPLAVVVAEEKNIWRNNQLISTAEHIDSSGQNQLSIISSPVSLVLPSDDMKVSCWDWNNIFSPPQIGEDYTILQAVFSIEMLALFLTTLCGLGGMLTMMDNLGQIGTALGYSLGSISTFVSLTSIWVYLGEVMVGMLSEIFITKYKFPRPLMFTLSLLLSCIGHLLIAFNVPNGLYAASIIIGFCFGGQWPLIFSVTSEIFGLKHCSTLNNVGVMACPLGSYLINVRVTALLCFHHLFRFHRLHHHILETTTLHWDTPRGNYFYSGNYSRLSLFIEIYLEGITSIIYIPPDPHSSLRYILRELLLFWIYLEEISLPEITQESRPSLFIRIYLERITSIIDITRDPHSSLRYTLRELLLFRISFQFFLQIFF